MNSPITPLTPQQTAEQEAQAAHEGYVHRILVAFDIFSNVLTDGDPDETISARSARAAEAGKPWGIAMSKFLNLFQKDHGPKAQSGDVARAVKVIQEEESSGAIDAPRPSGE
jgi:hypothetical protein